MKCKNCGFKFDPESEDFWWYNDGYCSPTCWYLDTKWIQISAKVIE